MNIYTRLQPKYLGIRNPKLSGGYVIRNPPEPEKSYISQRYPIPYSATRQ